MRIKPASNSFFLEAATPLFSRELLRPLRLMSLIVGIGILIAGSIWTPSIDWDVPLCFVMGLPAYVLAPWAFRQMYADICISPELLSKLLVRRVRYFIVRARSSIANGVVSQYSATLDVDSDPRDILQLSRFIAEGESHITACLRHISRMF